MAAWTIEVPMVWNEAERMILLNQQNVTRHIANLIISGDPDFVRNEYNTIDDFEINSIAVGVAALSFIAEYIAANGCLPTQAMSICYNYDHSVDIIYGLEFFPRWINSKK
jgi:hypothetical protein